MLLIDWNKGLTMNMNRNDLCECAHCVSIRGTIIVYSYFEFGFIFVFYVFILIKFFLILFLSCFCIC